MSATPNHTSTPAPSDWVCRFAPLVRPGGRVLDVACGGGRHARYFAVRGHDVEAVDVDAQCIAALAGINHINTRIADLEGGPWPYCGERFDGIVVTNYLHRPLLPLLVDAVGAGGVLIYETFAAGNERFGRPANPDHLLNHGELLEVVRARLQVVAYEDITLDQPRPAAVQRICAIAA